MIFFGIQNLRLKQLDNYEENKTFAQRPDNNLSLSDLTKSESEPP